MEERINASLSGRTISPDSIGAMLKLEPEAYDEQAGEITLSHVVDEREVNIYGTLHGGIITWLMDSTMGTLAKAYTGHDVLVTADIHVHFLKALKTGDRAMIKARITNNGHRLMNLVSEMNVGGELCATADAIFYKVGDR